jgi:hypothetical protein
VATICSGLAVAALAVVSVVGSASAAPDRALHGRVVIGKTGSGEGRVTSSPDGIDCGSRCEFSFISTDDPANYKPVVLTAKAEPGSAFEGFGTCGDTTCTIDPVIAGETYEVTAVFNRARPSQFPLSVSVAGSGRVTSAPAGISCPASCTGQFGADAAVALTATPTPGWSFAGWGEACSGTGGCTVTMNGPKAVTATFAPPDTVYALAVAVAGGTVTSDVPGIVCGDACVAGFGAGVDVTLTPSGPVAWGGACSGMGACVVPMARARAVTASIGGAALGLSPVAVTVTGPGTVVSTPAGISCGTQCGARFPRSSLLTLAATPAVGDVFAGWSGSCTGVSRICRTTLVGATATVATFVKAGTRYPVAVTKVGRGAVKSRPGGIACGVDCEGRFTAGGTIALAARPERGWVFVRWSGACKGRKTPCALEMNGPKAVSAVFGRVADPTPPRVTALPSAGRHGTIARLRYRVREASGHSTETARVLENGKLLATVKGHTHAVDRDVLFYFLPWRVTAAAGATGLRFCVTSTDPAGNRSKPSCAALRVT